MSLGVKKREAKKASSSFLDPKEAPLLLLLLAFPFPPFGRALLRKIEEEEEEEEGFLLQSGPRRRRERVGIALLVFLPRLLRGSSPAPAELCRR